jgi:hypothetical protein
MARKSDPARIYIARHAAIESNLTGSGMPQDDAERCLVAWERRAALAARTGITPTSGRPAATGSRRSAGFATRTG